MTEQNMQFHEAANIFPMMSDEEAIGLLEDIRQHGMQKPIETYEGKILDGRNRYLACLKLGEGFEYEYEELDGGAISDPVAYVLSANLHRRQLTPSQKAMVADKVRGIYDKRAKDRQKEGGRKGGQSKDRVTLPEPSKEKRSRDEAARAVGIKSGSLVDRARKVREDGVTELGKAVEDGRMSVTTAAKFTEEDEETQREAAAEAKVSGGRYRQPKVKQRDTLVPDREKTKHYALECARCAITQIERIPKGNPGREEAFSTVDKWIQAQRKKP